MAFLFLEHDYTTRIFVAHAIAPAVICGFVNWAFLPSKSESTTPRAVAQARQTKIGILSSTTLADKTSLPMMTAAALMPVPSPYGRG